MVNRESDKRVIPTLLLKDRGFYKTKRFKNPRYLGDPINILKIFNEKEVDEILILDISGSNSAIDYLYLKEIVSECFMPVAYGGNINSVSQIKECLKIGIEKVCICSALFNEEFIKSAVLNFGSSTIIGKIDIKFDFFGTPYIYTNGGRKKVMKFDSEVVEYINRMELGEICINIIDKEATFKGLDDTIITDFSHQFSMPFIISGGAINKSDIQQALNLGADAVAAGACFVYQGKHNAVLISYER